MPTNNKPIEPIVQTVWVDCPADEAFRLFTEGLGEWWPLADYSLTGDPAECGIEPELGGSIFERAANGEQEDWGTIIAWEPPVRLEFTWRPGRTEDREETVQVEFEVEAGGTLVTVTHRGWQRGEMSCALAAFAACARRLLVCR